MVYAINTKQLGYSLLELIVILTLLGILSASFIPKALELNSQSQQINLKQLESSLRSITQLVHAKAQIQGHSEGLLLIDGHSIRISDYYPEPVWTLGYNNLFAGNLINHYQDQGTPCPYPFCAREITHSLPGLGGINGKALQIWPSGKLASQRCYVYYLKQTITNEAPVIGRDDNEC